MKRMIYLSLLFLIPFILNADHGRNRLNGKWISPYFDTQIRIKVKRQHIKVKGLSRRGWTRFNPIRRNVFEDCNGNRIRVRNVHELVYVNRFRGEKIRFVKKGHRWRNHTCNSSCSFGGDSFCGFDNNFNDDYYYENGGHGGWNDDSWGFSKEWNSNRIDGRYFVREIDEYVTINSTRQGLKAKRGNGKWVEYRQNRNRKNEYLDRKGNRYLVRNDGSLTWKNKAGSVSLNLQK